ncbi:hypothetical protein CWI42_020180 [Ordospora colligata]|nr:hypothetical protein CWI42_020180 [Ordospora colligata]
MRIVEMAIRHGTKRAKPIFSMDVHGAMIATCSLEGEVNVWDDKCRLSKTIKKHTGAVLCIRFNNDGKLLASGGDDRMVFVYTSDGDVVYSASEHESDVSNVMWTDRFLISAGYDGWVVLHDLKTFCVVKKMHSHEGQIKGIYIDKNHKYMCTQGEDGIVLYKDYEVVKKMDASKEMILESFFSRMGCSPDGRFFASGLSFNTKCNSVEVFDCELKSECSLIGHAAPCEAVAFNPNVYVASKRYYVMAVSSQDLSLSLWTSLSVKPFVLIKNLTKLPVLDMCWDKKGTKLYVCSYNGEVMKIEFDEGELGGVGEGFDEEDEGIMFSVESKEMLSKTSLSVEDKHPENNKKVKKIVKPVLILSESVDGEPTLNGVEMLTDLSHLVMFNYTSNRMIEKTLCQTLSRVFGDFSIELNADRNCVCVKRRGIEFYRIHGRIELVCVSDKYLCVYTGCIRVYDLKTGVLAMPFICSHHVVMIDILRNDVLYLQSDGTFTVFSMRKRRAYLSGLLPRLDMFVSMRLDRKYFLIAVFGDEEYFFSKKCKVWFSKTPKYNTVWSKDTEITEDRDESLECLENEFFVAHTANDTREMKITVEKTIKAVCRMKKTTDHVEARLGSMIRAMIGAGEKDYTIRMLEKLNTNYSFQPFVFSILREIGRM